jgi:hypothetical protein
VVAASARSDLGGFGGARQSGQMIVDLQPALELVMPLLRR